MMLRTRVHMKRTGGLTGIACLGLIVLWLSMVALTGWLVEVVWNWLIPLLFHGPHITFWEALGVMFLISLLAALFK